MSKAEPALSDRGVFHLEERCEGCNGQQHFEAGAVTQILRQGYLVNVVLTCSTCHLLTRMQPEALMRTLTAAGRNAQDLVGTEGYVVLSEGAWLVNTATMAALPADDSVFSYCEETSA